MMHGNGRRSAISRHQFWAEMPEHKVSMTSLHWQTSLQTQKGQALTQWQQLLVNEVCLSVSVTGFFYLGGLTWCIVQCRLALSDPVWLCLESVFQF